MNTYPLRLIEFKSWLEEKNESDNVGWQGWCQSCPIFKGFQAKNYSIHEGNTIVSDKITYINKERLENLSWVQEFICKIDSLPLVEDLVEMRSPITAKQALEIVNNLYICTNCNKYNPEGKNCGKDNCDW